MEEELLQVPENQDYHNYDQELYEWECYCQEAEYQLWGL